LTINTGTKQNKNKNKNQAFFSFMSLFDLFFLTNI